MHGGIVSSNPATLPRIRQV
uniref:Uncharacterized protein n=1 Tax=Anguilla anguilla TaxID=7936 RepID=A0A0E9PDT5_ANGAN